jgi:hypothetical protein
VTVCVLPGGTAGCRKLMATGCLAAVLKRQVIETGVSFTAT